MQDVTLRQDGPLVQITGNFLFGINKKLPRAMAKIAFESLAYFLGVDLAYTEQFDPVRQYVLYGGEVRPFIMTPTCWADDYTRIKPPYSHKDGYLVHMQIAKIGFFVDLSPEFTLVSNFARTLYTEHGEHGLTIIPRDQTTQVLGEDLWPPSP